MQAILGNGEKYTTPKIARRQFRYINIMSCLSFRDCPSAHFKTRAVRIGILNFENDDKQQLLNGAPSGAVLVPLIQRRECIFG